MFVLHTLLHKLHDKGDPQGVIGNKELLFLVHAPNGLLLQLEFHKAQF